MASRNLGQQVTAGQIRYTGRNQNVPRAKARPGGSKTGEPNQTEKRFEDEYLVPLLRAGLISRYDFQRMKFRVGTDKCWFNVDWSIVWSTGAVEHVDVKGSGPVEDDAVVKIKAAAQQFPEFHWSWWIYMGKKKGWTVRRFNDCGTHPTGAKFPQMRTI